MYAGCLAPDVQVTDATFLLLMERSADLPTTWTDRNLMFVMTENVQYFSPFLPLNRILGDDQTG